MKKLILILLTLISTAVFSQAEYHIYKVISGPYNQYIQKYDTKETSVNMRMLLDNSVIKVFDDARSVYITRNYQEVQNDYTAQIAKWDGIDEKGRNVGIYMTFHKQTKESSLAVIYGDFIFQYFFYE